MTGAIEVAATRTAALRRATTLQQRELNCFRSTPIRLRRAFSRHPHPLTLDSLGFSLNAEDFSMSVQHVGVIGAGIVGLAVARRITEAFPGTEVTVLEKEDRVAVHQTGHNSGWCTPVSTTPRVPSRPRSAVAAWAC